MREHIRAIKHITQPQPDDHGSYGWYFYCGKGVGVKVIYSASGCVDQGCSSIKELRDSSLWRAARREMRALIKAEESGITPKPYCLKPVKRGYKWYPGIFMEHIGRAVTLYSLYNEEKITREEGCAITKKYHNTLEEYGIHPWDMNFKNILCRLNKYGMIVKVFVIDISPH